MIYGHPVIAATRALRFADNVTKRNGGSGNAQVSASRKKKEKHFKANKGSVPRGENVTTRIKANKMADIVDVVDRKRKAAACLVFVLLCEEDDGISLADNRLRGNF